MQGNSRMASPSADAVSASASAASPPRCAERSFDWIFEARYAGGFNQ
jgi:hypothetical protein